MDEIEILQVNLTVIFTYYVDDCIAVMKPNLLLLFMKELYIRYDNYCILSNT